MIPLRVAAALQTAQDAFIWRKLSKIFKLKSKDLSLGRSPQPIDSKDLPNISRVPLH